MRRWSSIVMLLLVSIFGLGSVHAQEEPYNPVIDPANFVEGVTNPFFPLTPGTTYVYEGVSGGETERIEVTMTHETREVLGITCVVVRDTVWQGDEMIEDTFDWYAQDKDGNVWYMGEDTKEYEGGEVTSTEGSWEAGVDGALPGVVMWGQPQMGEPYRQEYYVGEAEDMAEVLSLIQPASGGGFLTTREWSPLEPGYAEHKYYVAGIGLVLEVITEGGEGWVELVETRTE